MFAPRTRAVELELKIHALASAASSKNFRALAPAIPNGIGSS